MLCQAVSLEYRHEIQAAVLEELQRLRDDSWLAKELRELKQGMEHLRAEVAALRPTSPTEFDMHVEQSADQPAMSELSEVKQGLEHLQAEVTALQAKSSLTFQSTSANTAFASEESYASNVMRNPRLQYCLGESVWDTSLILGLPEIGPACSLFLGGVFVLNMFIQLYIVYVLLDPQMGFNSAGAVSDLLVRMTNWRHTDGHNPDYENANGVNLVNRVCNVDESLSLASLQVGTLKDINAYLNLDKPGLQLTEFLFTPGPVLCMICILILALLVVHDCRQDIYFLLCIGALPKQRTKLKGNKFESVSLHRFICIIILTCVRLGISLCLLYSGVVWFSSTSSMVDLILNAAALGFVLDIDEALFNSIVPFQVASLVRIVEPLHFNTYRFSRYKMDAALPVLFASATLAFAYWQHILPNGNTMLDIKKALCGPVPESQNFVVAQASSETEIVVSRYSKPFSAEGEHDGKGAPLKRAIIELTSDPSMVIDGHAWGQLTTRLNAGQTVPIESMWIDPLYYVDTLYMQMKDFATFYNNVCLDIDLFWSSQNRELVHVQERLRRMANVNEELSPAAISSPAFFRCSDYAKHCDAQFSSDTALLRMICPQTCGCDDALSGLWIAAPGTMSGCPGSCGPSRTRRFESILCLDFDPGATVAALVSQNSTYAMLANTTFENLAEGSPLFLHITEDHLLDLIGRRLGKEFQSPGEASAYIRREYDANPTSENNTMEVAGIDDLTLMTWTRYWKYVMNAVEHWNWKRGSEAFLSCRGAVEAWSMFEELGYVWNPCRDTEHMAETGLTSIKAFCPRTCYSLGLEGDPRVDQREFRSCNTSRRP